MGPVRRALGRLALRRGWCPLCNSSPPRQNCRVCLGTRDYGPHQSTAEAQAWARRWANLP